MTEKGGKGGETRERKRSHSYYLERGPPPLFSLALYRGRERYVVRLERYTGIFCEFFDIFISFFSSSFGSFSKLGGTLEKNCL